MPGAVTFGVEARASDSFLGTGGGDAGIAGSPGADCTPGTPGNENIALGDGKEVVAPGYRADAASASGSDECGICGDGIAEGAGVSIVGDAMGAAFAPAVKPESYAEEGDTDTGGAGDIGMLGVD